MNVRESFRYLFDPIGAPQDAQHGGVIPHSARQVVRSGEDFPDLQQQIRNVLAPWKNAGVRDAIGVPSIFRAVSLIAGTTGSLSVEVWRSGVKLSPDDTPQIVKRPDPFITGRDFYRNTAWNMATRGEAWWWVAKRDSNGAPISLINVPPWEVVVDPGTNRLHPTINWLGKQMPEDDMRHITLMPDMNTLRGIGPLQACGAAISVAVESTTWAANFFAGGNSSILIKAAGALGEDEDGVNEADTLRAQFMDKDNNTPRVIDEGIESVTEININPQGAQMLDARTYNNGDAARMFGIPGVLVEFAQSGSSLTYQSIPEVFRLFVKTCLQPYYLEPIEHAMSDILSRSSWAAFDTASFEKADPKTRWETYQLAVSVIGAEAAAAWANTAEGFAPGDIEYAPVPYAPPAAVPDRLPIGRSAESFRCTGRRILQGQLRKCNKLLWPGTERCPRCGEEFAVPA